MESSTTILRRMLDERGVEWETNETLTDCWTRWNVGNLRCTATEINGRFAFTVGNCTPEQAIAATLGSGTLTAEQVRKAIFDGSSYASFDGAKYYADGIGMQAIADELNSRAERTCRCTTDDSAWCFACSECGKSFPRSKLHLAHNHGEINYCPNCGAKVIEEEE